MNILSRFIAISFYTCKFKQIFIAKQIYVQIEDVKNKNDNIHKKI